MAKERASGQRRLGRLATDTCDRDWVYERKVECAPEQQTMQAADAAWQAHAQDLLQRSPFYSKKFRGAGINLAKMRTVRDLGHLPLTTKDELRESQQEYPPFGEYLAVPPESVKRVFQTSGTTGRPSLLALTFSDLSDVWGQIALRSYFATGFHPHHSVATNFGAGPFVAGAAHRVLERIGARTVPVAPTDTERFLNALMLGVADSLLVTPSFALHLVARLEEKEIDGRQLGVVHINVGGEPGGGIPAIHDRIESSFGAEVTEAMGLGDVSPTLFGECPVGGGMHFCGQGFVWMELIDPESGAPIDVEPGARGEPVYTHLVREAMPLVRFRSGDFVEIQEGSCPCERTSFRIRCVGRVDDMIIVRGVNVYPSAVQAVVSEFRPRVTGRLRLVVRGDGVSVQPPVPVEVEVPTLSVGDEALSAQIATAIRANLTFRADVRLVGTSEFGEAGYKTRALIRLPEE